MKKIRRLISVITALLSLIAAVKAFMDLFKENDPDNKVF